MNEDLPFTANPNVPQPTPAPIIPKQGLESHPPLHLDNMETKLQELDRNLTDWHQNSSKKISSLTEKIIDYAQYLEEDRRTQTIIADSQLRELKAIEDLIVQKITNEIQVRRESEARMQAVIEERFNSLKAEVCRESRTRYDAVEQLKVCLQNDFPKLQEMIKKEQDQREQSDIAVREKIDETLVSQVDRAIEVEKMQREETEEAILEMLKEMVGKIKQEIDNERQQRQENHDTLLNLLEDTCNKFKNSQGMILK